ncbi:MAG TPA: protein translocase subunit SecF [Candidatus Nanopelagicales bacterium]
MSRLGRLGHQLYSGEVSYDIVGQRRRWYVISGVIFLIAVGSLVFRGLNLGIEFTGGAEFQVPAASCTIEQARGAAQDAGGVVSSATQLGNDSIRITTEAVDQPESLKIRSALAQACGVTTEDVSAQVVGPTWGGEITQKALTALAVFIGLLSIFLAIYFDWRMAVAAVVALVHDIVITIGVYSLLHFEVTPSTVIGILTILGYSLYDTVVVFDKVKENTRGILGQSRQTYSQAANLAVNQTLVRSVNTSIVALLPVASILLVGAGLLGAGTLKDLSLALFVGMAAGTYSSIFIATPFLCQLMERQPQMQALARRVQSRGGGTTLAKEVRGSAQTTGAGPAAKGGGGGTATAVVERPDDEPASEPTLDAGGAAVDPSAEAMARARARRSSGPRNQPKRTPRSQR